MFAGLSLGSIESSLSAPAMQPSPLPTHGATPTGVTTQSADSGMMKIDFSEAKGTAAAVAAMAQQLVVGGSGRL